MVMTWFMGVRGLTTGCGTALYLRSGHAPDLTSAIRAAQGGWDAAGLNTLVQTAELSAKLAEMRVAFPLSVAEAMLGALLVIASGLAMGGRRGSRSLALQAVAANALMAVAAYVMSRGIRASWIDIVVRAAQDLPVTAPQRHPETLWWATRFKLILFDLGPLALATWVLTRERTKAFFEAAARQQPEPPEDS
jgi:hypothetical protein